MAVLTGVQLINNLGMPNTTPRTDAIAMAVSAAVVAYLRFDPSLVGLRTEFYDTMGEQLLPLSAGPIESVTNVWEDPAGFYGDVPNSFGAATLLVAGKDYAWKRDEGGRTGVLYRIGRMWPVSTYRQLNRLSGELRPCRGCVKVTYTLDPSNALVVARMAALLEATAMNSTLPYGIGTVTGDSLDGATVTVTAAQRRQGATPDAGDSFASALVAPMLRPFRRTLMAG